MKNVYLVKSGDYYDGMYVISVHETEESAIEFIEKQGYFEYYKQQFIAFPNIVKRWVSKENPDDRIDVETWELKP